MNLEFLAFVIFVIVGGGLFTNWLCDKIDEVVKIT
jgi:preprotein translocase subunit SecY